MFWDMCPRTLEVWQRNYNYAIQDEADRQDAFAWNLGLYVLEAIAAAFDGKNNPYPSEPRYLTNLRMESEAEQKKADEAAASKFWQWAEVFNKQRK